MARELSHHGLVIVVEGPMHQTLMPEYNSALQSPGDGQFTEYEDRVRIAHVMREMLQVKLMHFLAQKDFHNYRMLLNQQKRRFRGLDNVKPIDDIVPGFENVEIDVDDQKSLVFYQWMYQNGFETVGERDAWGWTPISYAAANGDPQIVSALLERRARPDDRGTKRKLPNAIRGDWTAMSIAAFFGNNEALKLMISFRGEVHRGDSDRGVPLHHACVADNAEAVQILLEAAADPRYQCFPGMDALSTASACDAISSAKTLLQATSSSGGSGSGGSDLSLRHCLHMALMFTGGSFELVTTLLDARADVNERFSTNMSRPGWLLLMQILRLKHCFSASRLTQLASHHQGATPLLFSVLNGQFDGAAALLEAKADLEIANSKGVTAAKLVQTLGASQILTEALQERPSSSSSSRVSALSAISAICAPSVSPGASPHSAIPAMTVSGIQQYLAEAAEETVEVSFWKQSGGETTEENKCGLPFACKGWELPFKPLGAGGEKNLGAVGNFDCDDVRRLLQFSILQPLSVSTKQ